MAGANQTVSEEMLRKMRGAAALNDVAMQRLTVWFEEGVTERALVERIDALYGQMRADGYYARIAFGVNTADPYHVSGDTPLQSGDTITVRLGCLLQDCFSVMARTFFFRHIDADQRDAFAAVRRINEKAFASSAPGTSARAVVRCMREEAEGAGFGAQYRADDPIPQDADIMIPLALEELAATDVAGMPFGDESSVQSVDIGSYFAVTPGVYVPGKLGACMVDTVCLTEYGLDVLSRFPHELMVV